MQKKPQQQCNKKFEPDTGSNDWAEFSGGSMQGWREYQEDAHLCCLDDKFDNQPIRFFAVFDGHGGSCVAKFCEKYFVEELKKNENFKKGKDDSKEGDAKYENYEKALQETAFKMDERLWTAEGLEEIQATHIEETKKGEQPKSWKELLEARDDNGKPVFDDLRQARPDAGCTANMCLFVENHLICANIGDSRTNIIEDNVALPLSEDHKPDLEREAKRVQNSGGIIIHGRVNMALSLTRAIGDLKFKARALEEEDLNKKLENLKKEKKDLTVWDFLKSPADQVISCDPEFKHYDVKKDNNKFVVLGCDGIWENDDADDKNINQVKWNIDKKSLSEIIEFQILGRIVAKKPDASEGTDNMTCIIIKFR